AMSAPKLALPPGRSQQFTATGLYDDRTTKATSISSDVELLQHGTGDGQQCRCQPGDFVTAGTNPGAPATISATKGVFTDAGKLTLLNLVSLSITPVFSEVTFG